jgi:hypothetical protein
VLPSFHDFVRILTGPLHVGELRKGHAKKLLQAGEVFYIAIAAVSIYATVKLMHGQEVH